MQVGAIAFTPTGPSDSPNVRAGSSHLTSYYRAMILCFASYRRFAPNATLILVTSAPPDDAYYDIFDRLGVDIVYVKFRHNPDPPLGPKFVASLYSLDALDYLARRFPDDQVVLLDPDCIAIAPLGELFDRCRDSIVVYPTKFPVGESSNGLSALEAMDIHRRLDPALHSPPAHYGGELYGFTGRDLVPVLARAERAYNYCLNELDRSLPTMSTEEHLMNFALRGARLFPSDDLVERIWTAPTYRRIPAHVHSLMLWHLPAEKDRGFAYLWASLVNGDSWWSAASPEEFRARLGSAMGIGRRSAKRGLYDHTGSAVRKIERALRSRQR